MKSIKILPITVAILATSNIYAQTPSEQKNDYGDNPNIFKVLAHKTGEKVQNTAERVGEAAERGVQKIKPAVDNAWGEAKVYTQEQTERAKIGAQNGAEKALNTANKAKDAVFGNSSGTVPIERGSLSQVSSNTTPHNISVQSNATNLSQETSTTSAPTITETNNLTQHNPNVVDEPEITKQSLPVNSAPAATANADDAGLPR